MRSHKCGCQKASCSFCCPPSKQPLRLGPTGPTGPAGVTGPTGPGVNLCDHCPPTTAQDGIELFVQDVGSGEAGTIVMLHAFSATSDEFVYSMETLAAQGFRVIAFDFRGMGRSDKPYGTPEVSGVDTFVAASDLNQILNCLGVQDITLVGHSYGALVATRYVSVYGCCRVSKLVLAGMPVTPFPAPIVDAFVAAARCDYAAFLTAFNLLNLPGNPSAAAWQTDQSLQTPLYNFVHIREIQLQEPPILPDVANICAPTLLLYGTLDPIFADGLLLQGLIPGSTFIPIVGCGHYVFQQTVDPLCIVPSCHDQVDAAIAAFAAA